MSDPSTQTEVLLRNVSRPSWAQARHGEPITLGVPFPQGVLSGDQVSLRTERGDLVPVQARVLDRWGDGSTRWLLVDFFADAVPDRLSAYTLSPGTHHPPPVQGRLRLSETPQGVEVMTGAGEFHFSVGGSFPFSKVLVGGRVCLDAPSSGLRIEEPGSRHQYRISSVAVLERGPLRVRVEIRAERFGTEASPLAVWAQVDLFEDMATARAEITVRNQRSATHPGGQWALGDPGSVDVVSADLVLVPAGRTARLTCSPELGAPLSPFPLPFRIAQESSGGDRWNSATHQDRDGAVSLRFRGYQLQAGASTTSGLRATPVVVTDNASGPIAVALPDFWQTFPHAITVDDKAITVGLFSPSSKPQELQGGEQKTHRVVIAFGPDGVSDPPLAWTYEPSLFSPSPEWSSRAGAVSFLLPANEDPTPGYLTLVSDALDEARGFFAKREQADEYGWRNFGDLSADHESAFQPSGQSFVSHYNNQYDAIAAFGTHFLRTGDPRWFRLMADLARHVRDIDLYHAQDDKAAYSGGFFWHTNHYTDAATSTHRTYPRGGRAGGGPSAEHNYNVGLMLHYFLTGDRSSRDAAVALGRWVIRMDDGRLTKFRWLTTAPTGLASFTLDYYGPGRGAGNSILACLVAHRLDRNPEFLTKAEELIRRSVNPNDDLNARDLLSAERRWSYTVFLQVLGAYLRHKADAGTLDEMFAYARASLLHYARWMVTHERPYLERPEGLEYPTETWAAQDFRKADVLAWAALYAESPEERLSFWRRSEFFFQYAVDWLGASDDRFFTRPLVIGLSNGFRFSWFSRHLDAAPILPRMRSGVGTTSVAFRPQKSIAIRRAAWVAAGTGGALLVGVLWLLFA